MDQLLYSGCVFIVSETESLGSSLLGRLLSTLKVPGSNPGVEGRNLKSVFILKRAHRAETGLTFNTGMADLQLKSESLVKTRSQPRD